MICNVQSLNPNHSMDKNSPVWPMRLVRLSEGLIVGAMCRQALSRFLSVLRVAALEAAMMS